MTVGTTIATWRLGLLLLTMTVVMLAGAAFEVSTRDELQDAIQTGQLDIAVMSVINIGKDPVVIANVTGLTIRGGASDTGLEGLGDAGNGLLSISGGSVTLSGLSFTKGYSSQNGGCVAVSDDANVVFDGVRLASCTAGMSSGPRLAKVS